MRKSMILASVLAAFAATTAVAGVSLGESLGTEDAAITQKLEAAGYTVTEIEREDDEIEVTVTKDGQEWEIELTPTGEVVDIEQED